MWLLTTHIHTNMHTDRHTRYACVKDIYACPHASVPALVINPHVHKIMHSHMHAQCIYTVTHAHTHTRWKLKQNSEVDASTKSSVDKPGGRSRWKWVQVVNIRNCGVSPPFPCLDSILLSHILACLSSSCLIDHNFQYLFPTWLGSWAQYLVKNSDFRFPVFFLIL